MMARSLHSPCESPALQKLVSAKPNANGLAIVITNDYQGTKMPPLTETHSDGMNITKVLQNKPLNYVVCHKKNVVQIQLLELLNIATQNTRYPKPYRIIIVFSGHGTADETSGKSFIFTQDCQIVSLEALINPFMPKYAPAIGTTPKLFLIDACQGDKTAFSEAVPVPKGPVASMAGPAFMKKGGRMIPTINVPPEGNYILAFPTSIGYQSFEIQTRGGLWLNALIEMFRVKGHTESVVNMLSDVNGCLMDKYQQPGCKRAMTQPTFTCYSNGTMYLVPQNSTADVSVSAIGTTGCSLDAQPSEVISKGSNKSRLNIMYHSKEISEPQYSPVASAVDGKFQGKVTFHITSSNETRSFESLEPKDRKKEAEDEAAMVACRFLDSLKKKTPKADGKGLTPSMKKQPLNDISTLKQWCDHTKNEHTLDPVLTTKEKEFQFRVNVKNSMGKLIFTAPGSPAGNKRTAKQNAARRANKNFGLL